MSTATAPTGTPRAITMYASATAPGDVIDLVHGWRAGEVLRVRAAEENGLEAHDWLLLKSSLSVPVRTTTEQLMIARTLATRRGYQHLGYDTRQDMLWALLPATLTVGQPFEIYRNPPNPDYIVSAHHVLVHRLEAVKWAGIDW